MDCETNKKTARVSFAMSTAFDGSVSYLGEVIIDIQHSSEDSIRRLILAAQIGDEAAARASLAEEPGLAHAQELPSGQTALHVAAATGDLAIVELLLEKGADPNALDKGDNASPLHYAAERGRLEAAKRLVEAGADVNWRLTVHEQSPLGWAVIFGDVRRDVADFLMASGAEVDLFSAIGLGLEGTVHSLIEADPYLLRQRMSRHERFRSAIEFATERRKWEVADLLVKLGAEVGLCEAAALGDEVKVAAKLREAAPPFALNAALKAAVVAGQVNTARLLLEAKADANYAPQGTSLLFDSICETDETMSLLLIDFGADLEFKDPQWHSTPIGWEVFFGRAKGIELAIKLGAEVGENLIGLAQDGRDGCLRRWSPASPEDYGEAITALRR
jgi:hypothetical protein